MAVEIISEQVLQTDTLNFNKYADALSDVIMNTSPLPLTVGIFGEAGSGKTTLMRMIRNHIQAHCKTIWFNAWKFNDQDDLANVVFKTIYDRAMQEPGINPAPVKEILKQVAGFLGEAAQGKRWGTLFFETLSHDPTYKALMEAAVHQVIKQYVGDDGRLVLFVDDLDHCSSGHIMTMLQTMNLHLNDQRCIVVLAGNRSVFEATMGHSYANADVKGKEAFGKIVHLPFSIPQPDKTRLRQYLYQQTLPTGEALKDVKQVADMVLYASSTMRHLKFMLNQLKLILTIGGMTSAKAANVAVLTKLLILQARFVEFYAFVERRPDAINLLHQVLSAKDKNARQGFFERVSALEKYAENDSLMGFLRVTTQVPCSDRTQVEQMIQLASMAR